MIYNEKREYKGEEVGKQGKNGTFSLNWKKGKGQKYYSLGNIYTPALSRMRVAAHQMVRNLTSGMAMITCRSVFRSGSSFMNMFVLKLLSCKSHLFLNLIFYN